MKELTSDHVADLIETDKVVIRLYKGKKLVDKLEYDVPTLDHYVSILIEAGASIDAVQNAILRRQIKEHHETRRGIIPTS